MMSKLTEIPLDELRQAESDLTDAKNKVNRLKAEKDSMEMGLRRKMTIGANVPCKVAKLKNGQYVVHVWVESPSNPNQLHIVDLSELEQ